MAAMRQYYCSGARAAAPLRAALLLFFLLSFFLLAAPAVSSIPRSSTVARYISSPFESSPVDADINNRRRPPWNLSRHINKHGYLRQLFLRIPPADIEGTTNTATHDNSSLATPVVIRQVPGDGDCLFHAIAISLAFIENGRLMRLDTQEGLQELKETSRKLRRLAVECLASCSKHKRGINTSSSKRREYKRLFIQGRDYMDTFNLLSTASSQYGITPDEYCELMMQDSYWGGGPEIVALCAVLRRPIHVYELVPLIFDENENDRDSSSSSSSINDRDEKIRQGQDEMHRYKDRTNNKFCLRLLATFGSPKFNSNEPLHILSADSRFPDIEPNNALKDGNHFLAMFPVDKMRECLYNCYMVNNGDGSNKEDEDDFLEEMKMTKMSDQKRCVRGGGDDASAITGRDDRVVLEADDDDDVAGLPWLLHGEWYDDLPCNIPAPCKDEKLPNLKKGSSYQLQSNSKNDQGGNPKSISRFIGNWINVFVRMLAYCGDLI